VLEKIVVVPGRSLVACKGGNGGVVALVFAARGLGEVAVHLFLRSLAHPEVAGQGAVWHARLPV